jgi:hypothetical protein
MPRKKEILQKKSVATKVAKMVKRKLQKVASLPKKASHSKAKVICKSTTPKELTCMNTVSHPASRSALRQSVRTPKQKKSD